MRKLFIVLALAVMASTAQASDPMFNQIPTSVVCQKRLDPHMVTRTMGAPKSTDDASCVSDGLHATPAGTGIWQWVYQYDSTHVLKIQFILTDSGWESFDCAVCDDSNPWPDFYVCTKGGYYPYSCTQLYGQQP